MEPPYCQKTREARRPILAAALADLIFTPKDRSDALENWRRGSAHLGYLPFPLARGQVYFALRSEPAAIRDLKKALRAPPVFPGAFVGSLTDAAESVAIVQVS